ncbi:OmpA family protein [Bdellovibrio sp. HCB288]|uniref:OmpA family protein n=1 Tax=Bdellovibrio sp. HCB288 TaxID=3394355 RepID=UPI0039B5A521
MSSLCTKVIISSAFVIGIIGCASKPPSYSALPDTSDPMIEVTQTEQLLNEARSKQMDVLSPDNFKNAEKALNKAKEGIADKDKAADILEQVSYSRGWLQEGATKSDIARKSIGPIVDARSGALAANAPEMYPKEWKKLESKLENVTSDVEKGSLKAADKRGSDLVASYRQLERDSVEKRYLGSAKSTIEAAEKDKASEKAPRSLGLARGQYNETMKLIAADPRNTTGISRSASNATKASDHLAEVMVKVNAGNTEALVLQTEKQQRQISSLRSETSTQSRELTAAEKQLQAARTTEAAAATATRIRSELNAKDAEVFAQDGKVTVRLKGLNFPSGSANLSASNKALLTKVESVLEEIPTSKIEVQGHTDSTGSNDVNMRISEKRAQAVQKQLIANGTPATGVDAIGLGDEKPIGSNNTAAGRAQNRRIDLVIEPKIQE